MQKHWKLKIGALLGGCAIVGAVVAMAALPTNGWTAAGQQRFMADCATGGSQSCECVFGQIERQLTPVQYYAVPQGDRLLSAMVSCGPV